MLRAVIIDDDFKAIDVLENLLHKFVKTVQVVATSTDPIAGIELVKTHQPDLVFLDVEMPELSGFEVLEQLGSYAGNVIFCSGYDHYAIKALRARAHDYLVKPIDIDDLKAALQAIELKTDRAPKTNVVLNERVSLPTSEGINLIDPKTITHCISDGNYTNVVNVDGKKLMVSKTLKDIESLFPQEYFCRIHHAHIVNLLFVKQYLRANGGEVELANGTRLSVSVRKKDQLLQRLK